MYLKGIKLIPFSVLVPVLSNPDQKKKKKVCLLIFSNSPEVINY